MKPVIHLGDWERPWKVDIWSLPLAVIEKKQMELIDLKRRMTQEHRRRILDCKYRLLTAAGRTPMYSGLYIYRAVVDHGMQELGRIVEFLKGNGIDVDSPNHRWKQRFTAHLTWHV